MKACPAEVDRYKLYLKRNLFRDTPTLSTIYESEEDRSLSPHRFLNRAFSPLPELIIEVEKRFNKHDEPEEFYVELEKIVQRKFRKDYLGINGSETSSDYVYQGSFHDSNNSEILNDNESFEDGDSHLTLQRENEEIPETVREGIQEGLRRENDEISEIQQECVEDEDVAEITGGSNYSGSSSTKQDQRSPEIMRRHESNQVYTSIDTRRYDSSGGITPEDDNLCSRNDLVMEDLEELNESFVEGDGEDQFIGSIENVPTFTSLTLSPILPSSSKPLKRKQENEYSTRKRRSVYSFTSSQDSLLSTNDFCVQTDFSNDSFCLQTFRNRLFQGTPTIFNICRCADHQCS